MMSIDRLDAALLSLLDEEPRIGVLEAARRLQVARGTVQARLDRLQQVGVIRSLGPDVDPAALGYGVTAFITVQISQAVGHNAVAEHLAGVPEVLEVHTITGAADLLVRAVARSNEDLQRVIDAMVATEGITRASSAIALRTQVAYRTQPLVTAAVTPERSRSSAETGTQRLRSGRHAAGPARARRT